MLSKIPLAMGGSHWDTVGTLIISDAMCNDMALVASFFVQASLECKVAIFCSPNLHQVFSGSLPNGSPSLE